MNSRDEILAKLRAGEPFEKIRKEMHSVSKLYEVTGQYLDEIEEDLEGKRAEISKVAQEKSAIGAEIGALRQSYEHLTVERAELAKKADSANADYQKLTTETTRLHKELDKLKIEIKELEDKGFTPQIIAKLKTANEKNGGEVNALLQKQDEAHSVDGEVVALKKAKNALNVELQVLRERKQKLENKLKSKKNKLDLLEAQEVAVQDVAALLKATIKEGYKPEQLKGLLFWLRELDTAGKPDRAINLFLQCIAEAKNLVTIRNEAHLAETRLAELLKAETELKAKIEIEQKDMENRIENMTSKGLESIARVEAQATAEVSKVASQSTEALKNVNSAIAEAIHRNIDELARLQEEKGKLQNYLQPARVLAGILENHEFLGTIAPELAIVLLQKLAMWCSQKYPNADIGAFYDCVANEFQPTAYATMRFQVSALITLAAQGVTRITMQHLREETK